ncbi:MAG: outer membrane beta-barrel protein [Gemmatimonadaceae bacterium]
MKRTLLTAASLALLALPASAAHAQIGFGVAGGPSFPMGDFKKAVDGGYHITGIANLGIPLLPVGLRFEGSFSEFDYKSGLSTTDAKARVISGVANAILSTPGILGPYLIGGIGVYNASAQCSGCSSSDTKVGFNGGAGFKIGLAGLAVFAEARYHYVPGGTDATTAGTRSATQFVPLSVGITF